MGAGQQAHHGDEDGGRQAPGGVAHPLHLAGRDVGVDGDAAAAQGHDQVSQGRDGVQQNDLHGQRRAKTRQRVITKLVTARALTIVSMQREWSSRLPAVTYQAVVQLALGLQVADVGQEAEHDGGRKREGKADPEGDIAGLVDGAGNTRAIPVTRHVDRGGHFGAVLADRRVSAGKEHEIGEQHR